MGIDWTEKFKALRYMPINSFCKKLESLTNETDILKKELKAKFPKFSLEAWIAITKFPLNLNNKILLQCSKDKETSPSLH